MKSMMWKTTFREIKQSFGRFFAILAIIALGVGFYAGLVVTKPAMVQTTQEYLEENQFYDFRLLSTQGFDQESVDSLTGQEYVRAVEGALSFDIICSNAEGSEFVVKAHSLTESVNTVTLTAGRMPEKPDECVVDANLYSESQLGQVITLSDTNEQEDLDHFAAREYTIVGIVQSPLYIQFERGNTSLGSGRVSGFIYLKPEGFDEDYFTEIYVKFDKKLPLFSEEYEAWIEERKAVWEQLTENAANRRRESLMADAEAELDDARQELEDKKAEAEKELEDAKKELDEAAEELKDGEVKIQEAKEELRDACSTVKEKTQELADAEITIAEEEQKLVDGEKELQDGIDTWNEQNDKVENAKSTLKEKQSELNQQRQQLEDQEAGVDAQEEQLNGKAAELDATEAALLAQFGTVPEPYASQIAQGRQEIEQYRAQLSAGREQLAEGFAMIDSYQTQIHNGMAELAQGDSQLAKAWMEIEKNQTLLADGRKELENAKAEVRDGYNKLSDALKEIRDGEQKLADSETELADGRREYEDGLAEYEDANADFQKEIKDAEEKLADARQELADVEAPDTYVLGRDTNVGYACFESDSGIVEGIANIFPIFFFAVAALVCITTMNRMVEEQRTQIGVLKALGYGEARIMMKYLFYSGMAAVLGCVTGFFAGTYLFPRVIWTAYGIMYRVDTLIYIFDWPRAIISLAVSLACSIGTTWFTCRYELLQVTAQLMRPKSPKAGKRVLLERIPFIWKRMKFLHKVSYRNIFRYKKRFFMMVIGISGCTALLVTGFGVKDSVGDVADRQFDKIQIYDIGIAFSDAVNEDTEKEFVQTLGNDEDGYTLVMEKSLDLVTDGGIKAINLVVAESSDDITPFLDLHTTREEPIVFPGPGEAVLTHKIADQYGVQIGDRITLRDDEMNDVRVTVSGINENFIYNYVYLDAETYREHMGEPEFKVIYLNLSEGADTHTVSAALMKLDSVSSVTVNSDTRERFGSMMESLNLIVLVVILCAACLALIVLYNLTNINITERIREIATIKVLGFYKKETASYVFRENVVLTLIGAAAGLVLGHFLHLFVMNEIVVDMVAFDIRVRPVSYVYSIVLTLGFAWLVNLIMGRKLERVSMTESLKSID